MISSQEFAARAEHILRAHVHFGQNAVPMLRILVLPAAAEYECWQVILKKKRGAGDARYVGVYGRWDAFRDARELFDPGTGESLVDKVVPSIEWRELDLEMGFGDDLIHQMRAIRVPLVAPLPYVMMDGIRYEIYMQDPEGAAATASFCWTSRVPSEWVPIKDLVDLALDKMSNKLSACTREAVRHGSG